jgi:hypothetical protein
MPTAPTHLSGVLLLAGLVIAGCSSSEPAHRTEGPPAAPDPPSSAEERLFREPPFVIPDSGDGDHDLWIIPPGDVDPKIFRYRWHSWRNGPFAHRFFEPDVLPDSLPGLHRDEWMPRPPGGFGDERRDAPLAAAAERLRRSAERMREQAERMEDEAGRLDEQIRRLNDRADRLRDDAERLEAAADRLQEQEDRREEDRREEEKRRNEEGGSRD